MVSFSEPRPDRPYLLATGEPGERLDSIDRDRIIASYQSHGALLFRGFDMDIPRFSAFTRDYCASSMFNESPNRALLDTETQIQSVDLGIDAFPLHPELSREPWKPDVCFFHCIEAPDEGGETTICDGVELVRKLPPEIRDGFAARRLLYVAPAAPHVLQFWLGTPHPTREQLASPPPGCPYNFFVAGGRIVRAFTRPALHKPMFCDEPAFGNFLLFARYYLKKPNFPALDDGSPVPVAWIEAVKAVGDQLTVPVKWQRGDLLMIDNTRFMHGRNAIEDAGERQIASYFGYLNFAVPNPEEPVDAPWRRANFRPPLPPVARPATPTKA
ncbi:MAG: hypothetical protein CMN73_12455 [Sphingomonas sp.]|nr:hypothetical protein [Sphingomonas sp.]